MLRLLLTHSFKTILHNRKTAIYLVAAVALTSAHIPFSSIQAASMPGERSLRLDFGQPPLGFFHIAYHSIAWWFAFLGVLWDVRLRMKEWALIRLCGGHPCLVAGFQYLCLSLLGILMGGGFSILIGSLHPIGNWFLQMVAISVWGIGFSFSAFAAPSAYTEFFDIVPVLRIEGEAR